MIGDNDYYAKSKDGLWVRAQTDGMYIEVSHTRRYEVSDGMVMLLNAEGDVERSVSVLDIDWDAEIGFVSIGKIPIDMAWVEWCGLEFFDRFIKGVMRHIVLLIVNGWGTTPAEVLSWFADLRMGEFVATSMNEVVTYTIYDGVGIFEGMERVSVEIDEVAPGEEWGVLSGQLVVAQDTQFDLVISNAQDWSAFVISAVLT